MKHDTSKRMIVKAFLPIIFLFFVISGSAMATVAGPRDAGTGTTQSGVGTINWSNPGYITADDNSYSTVTIAGGGSTYYLKGTNYGFNIPSNAVINGITVTINKQSQSSGSSNPRIRDNRVRLVKGGTVIGNNYGITSTDWPTALSSTFYGGSADLWGTTWTAADINSANFGVVLSANNTYTSALTATVDFMQINVTYTVPLVVNITAPAQNAKVKGAELVNFTDTDTTSPQCSVDNSTWTACTSGVTILSSVTGFSALTQGAFTLYLKDSNGVETSTNNRALIKDTLAPSLTSVHIQSNYSNSSMALVGNSITLTFAASESIGTPIVTIDGNTAIVTGTGPYSATYVLASDDPAGQVVFNIAFTDLAGNAGTLVTATTDASYVKLFFPVCITRFAGTGSNVNGPGTIAWSNTGNIIADDTNYATSILGNSETTEYLQGTNYVFSLPSNAVVTGIMATISRTSGSNSANNINDADVYLLKAGAITGNDKATSTDWTSSMTAANYGGSSDLWGTTWTSSDIDNANFGLSLSAQTQGSSRTASVDYMNLTVCYVDDVAPTLTAVHIQSNNSNPSYAVIGNQVSLSFTASETITPTVTVAGHSVSVSGTNPYTATYLMQSVDTDGFVSFSIAYTDMAGNIGTTVGATSDGSFVRYFGPVLNCVSKNANNFTDDSSVGGISWSNPSNAQTSNDVDATASSLYSTSDRTHYLKATNFGFSIPSNAVIKGIFTDVEKSANLNGGTDTYVVDYRVRLVWNGTMGTTDKADTSTKWETTDTVVMYGTSTDLWGTTWTANEINNANTGFVISATKDTTTINPRTASIDYINMTVCYSVPAQPNTCSCPPVNSNWNVNLADNCVLSTTCDLGTGILSFSGAGSFTIDSTLTSNDMVGPPSGSTIWIKSNGRWNVK